MLRKFISGVLMRLGDNYSPPTVQEKRQEVVVCPCPGWNSGILDNAFDDEEPSYEYY